MCQYCPPEQSRDSSEQHGKHVPIGKNLPADTSIYELQLRGKKQSHRYQGLYTDRFLKVAFHTNSLQVDCYWFKWKVDGSSPLGSISLKWILLENEEQDYAAVLWIAHSPQELPLNHLGLLLSASSASFVLSPDRMSLNNYARKLFMKMCPKLLLFDWLIFVCLKW